MHLVQNIVIAIFLTINLGRGENHICIKPSVYTMPEIVFTNQANMDLSRSCKVINTNPKGVRIISAKGTNLKKGFSFRLTFPDLVILIRGDFDLKGERNQDRCIYRLTTADSREKQFTLQYHETLAYKSSHN